MEMPSSISGISGTPHGCEGPQPSRPVAPFKALIKTWKINVARRSLPLSHELRLTFSHFRKERFSFRRDFNPQKPSRAEWTRWTFRSIATGRECRKDTAMAKILRSTREQGNSGDD